VKILVDNYKIASDMFGGTSEPFMHHIEHAFLHILMQFIAVPLTFVYSNIRVWPFVSLHRNWYIDKVCHICAFLKYYQPVKQVFTLRSCLQLATAVLHVWMCILA